MLKLILLTTTLIGTSCNGCDTVEEQPWEFGEPAENGDLANNAANDRPFDPRNSNNALPENNPPDNVEIGPIERVCDGTMPSESVLSEAGRDVVRYSLAVGADGCPMASWYAVQRIRFARWNGSIWEKEDAVLGADWENALISDAAGAPTLFVKKSDTTGFTRWRREGGEWVEKESTGARWNWGMRAESASLLVARTATQEYTGSDLALHVVRRTVDEWTWSRVVDFDVRGLDPPRLTYVGNRVVLPILENKGYGPTNRETNLWLATSDDDTLSSWSAERVPIGALNDFSMAFLYAQDGQLRLLGRAEVALEAGSRQLIHASRTDDGWRIDRFDECLFSTPCELGAVDVDSSGRLHLVRGDGRGPAEGYSVELGVLDGSEWRFLPVGVHLETPSAIAIDDETGAVHLAKIQRENARTRNLVYVPVEVP